MVTQRAIRTGCILILGSGATVWAASDVADAAKAFVCDSR